MLRAVLERAGSFRLVEAPESPPGPGEVLLGLRSVGICGSDMHLFREGAVGGIAISEAGEAFTPGHECSASVLEVGEGVDPALAGRLVAVDPSMPCGKCRACGRGWPNLCTSVRFLGCPPVQGVLRERFVHPATGVTPLPESMDADSGMMLEPLGVAVHALEIGKVRGGLPVAVLGSGCIGLCCLMLLAEAGAEPLVATDVLDYRLELARELGATHTLNPDRDDVPARVAEITGGEGADFVLECAGADQTQRQMVECAAVGGRALVLGVPEGADQLAFSHSSARRKGLSVLMIRRCNVTLERVLERAVSAKLPLARLVTHKFPLEEVQTAFDTAAGYLDGVVKAAVHPSA
ncbi:MAG: zinc-dependent alcohol dehydrogenase [Planctomycetota bacterium]|jgi:L-iditol 2-dehydrogenase